MDFSYIWGLFKTRCGYCNSHKCKPIFLSAVISATLLIRVVAATEETSDSPLQQLIKIDFSLWDKNHDGKLSADEINALIEDPKISGAEAAALVVIRRNFPQDNDENNSEGLPQDTLLSIAAKLPVNRAFSRIRNQITTANHSLFLPSDPNLLTFHQGRVGDCYLLAVIGSFVNRDPQAVRAMIKPLNNNTFEVDFASGQRIDVANVTDAELLLGAKTGTDHGVWLSILEKAYAAMREIRRKAENNMSLPNDDVPKDYLGGGRPAPAIEQFTGHKSANTPLANSAKNDLQGTEKRIHELLAKLTQEHRLIATGTSGNGPLPPRIPHGHVFGILGYNETERIVQVFNPWGDEFMPSGISCLSNGYVTQHGTFYVPLQDFVQIFKSLTYETDQPIDR